MAPRGTGPLRRTTYRLCDKHEIAVTNFEGCTADGGAGATGSGARFLASAPAKMATDAIPFHMLEDHGALDIVSVFLYAVNDARMLVIGQDSEEMGVSASTGRQTSLAERQTAVGTTMTYVSGAQRTTCGGANST